jgi:hypothetical protein
VVVGVLGFISSEYEEQDQKQYEHKDEYSDTATGPAICEL